MSQREQDRVLALAALMQAVNCVQQIAETGQVKQSELDTALNSLLMINSPSTEAIYGGVEKLKSGLQCLCTQLSKNKQQRDVSQVRYVIGLIHLQKQLAKHPAMLDIISRELEQIPQQIEYFGDINSPQVIARFADIYHRTISELSPRIQVHGEPTFLQQPDNVNKIRALLLAGIRATMLWRQLGGRRWQFIFQSGKILQTAVKLQQTI
jgi:high frequency lysogenization protein